MLQSLQSLIAGAAAALAIAAAPSLALAHFVFIVPGPAGVSGRVLMSESLEPDGEVPVRMLLRITDLSLREASGSELPLHLRDVGGEELLVSLPGEGNRVVRGTVNLGRTQRGGATPHLLVYHPKTILGDAFDISTQLGWSVPVELVPVGKPGAVALKLLTHGTPEAEAEVTVILPDGSQQIVVTDEQGTTPTFDQTGRYGAWARYWIEADTEVEGGHVGEIRHYATLVFDAGESAEPKVAAAEQTFEPTVEELPALLEATSSHGAVAVDGELYIYGGHVSPTHVYHTEGVSGAFYRTSLAGLQAGGDVTWDLLPPGRGLQGMNLAAHDGTIYLVGGMKPQNAEGEPDDHASFADVRAFDLESESWSSLPPLPIPRSSHDIVVIDGKLYVVGGWNLSGSSGGADWMTETLVLDLANPSGGWGAIDQPFERRALIVAEHDGKLWVIGGFDSTHRPHLGTDIYDPASGEWTTGPELPGPSLNGFSAAACVLNGTLYASVADGTLVKLAGDGMAWERVTSTTPRIVHRLIPDADRNRILVVGGAADGDNFDLIEAVNFGEPEPQATIASDEQPDEVPVAEQTVCPVMTGMAVDENSTVVKYDGVDVRVCCETCAFKFERDPAAYVRAGVVPQLAGREPERELEQVFCPVYTDRVVSSADPFVMHDGKKIHVFNEAARRRFEKNPESYLKR